MVRLVGVLIGICTTLPAVAQDDLGKRASWTAPTAGEVKADLLVWLRSHEVAEETKLQIETLWPEEALPQPGADLLEHVAITIAVLDKRAEPLIGLCRGNAPVFLPAPPEMLFDENLHDFPRNNLRLYYGRWLAQHSFYDEGMEMLEGLLPGDVVDPASLLFYQSVSYHRLLKKDECLKVVERLLENESSLPQRYLTVARLMESDIKPLKTDSLDEISRMMDDIRRRLHLGRAGTRVRDEEEDVIAKLDKMIEEMEKKQKQQQSSGNSGGNLQPSNPAQDSQALGGKGPGDVDPKRLQNKSSWGNLPPKERQEALQQISKDLPAHFRDVIEEYFRKLARDGGN
jgi:hypothetical protein